MGSPQSNFSCAVCYGGFVVHLFGVWRVMGSPQSISPVHHAMVVLRGASFGVWRLMGSPQSFILCMKLWWCEVVHLWSVALDGLPSIISPVHEAMVVLSGASFWSVASLMGSLNQFVCPSLFGLIVPLTRDPPSSTPSPLHLGTPLRSDVSRHDRADIGPSERLSVHRRRPHPAWRCASGRCYPQAPPERRALELRSPSAHKVG